MRQYFFIILTLVSSPLLFANSPDTQYKAIELTKNIHTVSFSNGLINLKLPTHFLENALILAVNDDITVILNKKEKKAFSISTIGNKEVFSDFKHDLSQLNNTISDIPGILFGIKKQKIHSETDEELRLSINKLHKTLFMNAGDIKKYYSKANGRTVYYYLSTKKNVAFVVNKQQTKFFTIIDSDNLNSDDFINYIVKGLLQ